MLTTQTRRRFLAALSSADAAGLLGSPNSDAQDAPLETTTIRLRSARAEGFTDIRYMVERGFTTRYDYALQTLKELPYARWRNYDAEDTVRFYALRLREAGMIKSPPSKFIAEATDWRFMNKLKCELKG
jgi:hypothetical protein